MGNFVDLPDSGVPLPFAGCVIVGELAADLPLGAFVFVSFGTLPVLRNAAATCALARLEDIINVVQTYKIREGVILSTPKTNNIYIIKRVFPSHVFSVGQNALNYIDI